MSDYGGVGYISSFCLCRFIIGVLKRFVVEQIYSKQNMQLVTFAFTDTA